MDFLCKLVMLNDDNNSVYQTLNYISQLIDLLINEVYRCLLTLVSEYTNGLVLISSYQNTVLIISTNIVDNN